MPASNAVQLIQIPLQVIRCLLIAARERAAALSKNAKEREWLTRALTARIWSGIELVEAGMVRFDKATGKFFVTSSQAARRQAAGKATEYAIFDSHCDCPDHRHGKAGDWRSAPEGQCKHLAAVAYVRLLEEKLAALTQASEPATEEAEELEEADLEKSAYRLTPKAKQAIATRIVASADYPYELDLSTSQITPYHAEDCFMT